MSVHDETWDKCSHCGKTQKTWEGDFHKHKHCLNFNSWHEFNEKFSAGKILTCITDPKKCEVCGELIEAWKNEYHKKYCKDYSYEEYLKLMNDYPAKKRNSFNPISAIPEKKTIWRSDQPKTLEDYHKIYPARAGDTVEKFRAYEAFCERSPVPKFEDGFRAYQNWYNALAAFMESMQETKESQKHSFLVLWTSFGQYEFVQDYPADPHEYAWGHDKYKISPYIIIPIDKLPKKFKQTPEDDLLDKTFGT